MKFFFTLAIFLISLTTYACPDLTGSYIDRSGESVVLSQIGCDEVTVLSRPLSDTLPLDNQYKVVVDDFEKRVLGRGSFEGIELVIEARIEYKRDPGIPGMLLPVRAVNKYSQTATGDLLEKSTLYNVSNKVLTNTKLVYKRQSE